MKLILKMKVKSSFHPAGQVDFMKDLSNKVAKAFVTCSIANAMVSSYM